MITVGLDLSLTGTGWAAVQWDASGHRVLEAGVIKPGGRGPARLVTIRNAIMGTLAAAEPDTARYGVAIEGYSFASRGNTAYQLGELRGVVIVALWDADIPYIEIPPSEWRKVVLGKGNLAKEEVSKETWKRYGVEFPDLNTTEAFCVAMCHYLTQTGQAKPPVPRSRSGKRMTAMTF